MDALELRQLLSLKVACYVAVTAVSIKYTLEMLGELAVSREDNTLFKAAAVTCLGLVGGVILAGLVPEALIRAGLAWGLWWWGWAALLRWLYTLHWRHASMVGLLPILTFWLII